MSDAIPMQRIHTVGRIEARVSTRALPPTQGHVNG
jgi:hypothetical protein